MNRIEVEKQFSRFLKRLFWLCSIMFFFNNCTTVPLSQEENVSIQSVSINKDIKIEKIYKYKPDVQIGKLNQDTLDKFGMVPYLKHTVTNRRGPTRELVRGKAVLYRIVPVWIDHTDTFVIVTHKGNWAISPNSKPAIKRYWAETGHAPLGMKAMSGFIMQNNNIDIGEIIREQFMNALIESQLFSSVVPEGGDAEFQLSVSYGLGKKPLISVMATLLKPDGTLVWREYDYITALNKKTPSHPPEEYLNQPKLIREAFTVASQIVVETFIKALQRK
jgi:hypothetical protein